MKKIHIFTEMISCDDGMVVIKTGCVDGNGKSITAIINEKLILNKNQLSARAKSDIINLGIDE